MKRFLWFSAFILVISGATAQTGASPKAAPKKSTSSARVSAKDVQELRDALAAQQKQAEEQRQQLDQVRSQLQQLLDATQQANASAQQGAGQRRAGADYSLAGPAIGHGGPAPGEPGFYQRHRGENRACACG